MAAFAKRSLGQNFLVDANVARKIVHSLEATAGDLVVEIGPGRGALTHWLTELPGIRLRLLEKDTELAQALPAAYPQAEVVVGDALAYPWEGLAAEGAIRIIGNLPYNVASPLLWDMVQRATYVRAVAMVQYEVARRLCAPPGGKEYGGLSVWIQSHAASVLLFKVGPDCFRPRPKVDSAVVAFTPLPVESRPSQPQALARALKHCFALRRKQLGAILRGLPAERVEAYREGSGMDFQRRPETLTPQEFQDLARVVFL